VRRVSLTAVARVAGGGGSGSCAFSGAASGVSLNGPRDVAVDAAGNVYIADTGRDCVRRVTAGNVSRVAGGGGSTSCAFSGAATGVSLNNPSGVEADTVAGVVYVSDSSRDCIRRVALTTIDPLAGTGGGGYGGDGGPAVAAQLNDPRGLAFTSAGDLLVADRQNDRVRIVNAP
jgi:DNA-binding beta-propeller fold protein YncE